MIWQLADSSSLRLPVGQLLGRGKPPAQAAALESRLASQFINMNRGPLAELGIEATATPTQDGHVDVALATSARIGAIPLRSPVSGETEYGVLVSPRFGWDGVGEMLVGTGARILPRLPRLSLLPRSARAVPAWVIAAVVLSRLEALLEQMTRRFEPMEELSDRPRGRVTWATYVSRHIARGRPERVPCRFSSLQSDARLLGAAHATALKQLAALAIVRSDALIARRLMERFERLRQLLSEHPPRWGGLDDLAGAWRVEAVDRAIEAMSWTRDDRGLAGISPAGGLPWWLPMEQVFEAWVEVIVRDAARLAGGIVRTGRLRQTVRPLGWSPPYAGSQRFLLPDLEWLREDKLVVLDAKYKSHWEELEEEHWFGLRESVREAHRADLLQVLAYAAASDAKRVTCALVYPCSETTWASLRARDRVWHAADVPAGARSVQLRLMALPLGGAPESLAGELVAMLAGE